MKLFQITLIAFFLSMFFNASTGFGQTMQDDIYFSTTDQAESESPLDESIKTESSSTIIEAEPSESISSDDDYRVYSDDFSSEKYYDDEGNEYIINNYYYEDYQYSNNIRKYYDPYWGFSYYSPYYSPYHYDPYYYSSGWNMSFGFGWGAFSCGYWPYYSHNYYPWYDPFYSYNPWYNNYYGYNSYYNGYNNGYWNGYNDGYNNSYYNDYYGNNNYNDYNNDNGSGNGYYYGPRNETASNTTSTGNGSNYYSDSFDKIKGVDDKALEVGNTSEVIVSEKGGVISTNTNEINSTVVDHSNTLTIEAKPSSVRVIKYYNAESQSESSSSGNTGGRPNYQYGPSTTEQNSSQTNVQTDKTFENYQTKENVAPVKTDREVNVSTNSSSDVYKSKTYDSQNSNSNTTTTKQKTYKSSTSNSSSSTSNKTYSNGSTKSSSSGSSGTTQRSSGNSGGSKPKSRSGGGF